MEKRRWISPSVAKAKLESIYRLVNLPSSRECPQFTNLCVLWSRGIFGTEYKCDGAPKDPDSHGSGEPVTVRFIGRGEPKQRQTLDLSEINPYCLACAFFGGIRIG